MSKEKIKAIGIAVWMVFLTAYFCFSPNYSCEIDIWAKFSYILVNILLLIFAFTSYPNTIIKSFRAWQIIITSYNICIAFVSSNKFWDICNNRLLCLLLCTIVALIFLIEWIKLARE